MPTPTPRRRFLHPDALEYEAQNFGGGGSNKFSLNDVGDDDGDDADDPDYSNNVANKSAAATTATPFAWLPILAISVTLVVLTATMSSLYTYVGVYVQDVMDLESTSTAGYYAGWLASAFTLGRLTTGYAWGVFADRYGRKPVLVIGMISVIVCSIGFGLSTSLGVALLWRLLFGMTISVWSVARIMIPEILGPEHVVVGMACMPASSAIGTVLGPLFGGLLAQPALVYPDFFSKSGLFGRHPFLLPNVALACLALALLPFVLFHLPETMVMPGVRGGVGVANSSSSKPFDDDALQCRDSEREDQGEAGRPFSHDNSPSAEAAAAAGRTSYDDGVSLNVLMNNEARGLLKAQELQQSTRTAATINSSVSSTASFMIDDDLKNGSDDSNHSHEQNEQRIPREHSTSLLCSAARSLFATVCCRCAPMLMDGRSLRAGGRCWCCPSSRRMWKCIGPASPAPATAHPQPWLGPGGLLEPWYVKMILVVELFLATMKIGFDECLPLWVITSRESGGLDWHVSKIGKVLTWTGVAIMFYQFIGYPFLCKTVGIVRLLRFAGVVGCLLVAFLPDIWRIEWGEGMSYFVPISVLSVIDAGTSVWNIGMALAAANAVPMRKRGQFMGIFTVAETFGRAISPAFFGSLLAWSIQYSEAHKGDGGGFSISNLVDYHLVFVLQALCVGVIVAIGWRILTLEKLTIPYEDRRESVHDKNVIVDSGGGSPVYAPVVLA